MNKAKYSDVELSGAKREKALNTCKRQMAAWGLSLPDVAPLVLDFGLKDFSRTGLIEYWVANEREAGYCGKFLFLFDGQECPEHHHDMKHETFFVMKGSIKMKVNDKVRTLNAGDLLIMPPGNKHSFQGIGPALLLEISQPSVRGDNFFLDEKIGNNGVI